MQMKNGPWLSRLPVPDMLVAGILLMLAGDFLFALNDAMGKWLVASFSVGQVVLVRPDGHIAWRSTVAVQPVELDQRTRQLEHVLAAATGHRDSLPA